MRFSEKLKFFVFGGCFVALGVALTYLTGIEASDEKDLGEIKQFDTILCKNIAVVDNDDNTRILLNTSQDTPSLTIVDSNGDLELLLHGSNSKIPTGLLIGTMTKTNTKITPNGVVKRVNEEVISEWP